jgi:hypothetical protein
MGIYSGPEIVKNGLVLHLDAASGKGYDRSENLLLRTSNIGVTPGYGLANNVLVTLNSPITTAPNGLFEATLVDNNNNAGDNFIFGNSSSSLITDRVYTYSIHVKQGTRTNFHLIIDESGFGGKRYQLTFTFANENLITSLSGLSNNGSIISSSFIKLDNNWYRLFLTFKTSTATVGSFVDMINRLGGSTGTNYVWGRQLEFGETRNSYYPTETQAKLRGTTWFDLSGNGNNGSLENGVGYNSGNLGSLVFDGVNNYVNSNYFPNLSSGDSYCHSVWFRTTGVTVGDNGSNRLVEARDAGKAGNPLIASMLNHNTNNTLVFFVRGANGARRDLIVSGISVNDGVWKHAHFQILSNGHTQIYLNGELLGQNTSSVDTNINLSDRFLAIGARNLEGNISSNFNGNISQVQIYNRALTPQEVRQNFYATRGRYNV